MGRVARPGASCSTAAVNAWWVSVAPESLAIHYEISEIRCEQRPDTACRRRLKTEHLSWVVSSSHRNAAGQNFRGGPPSEDPTRPTVQRTSDARQVGGGADRQVGALGEVLPQEAVGVLVGAPLPR